MITYADPSALVGTLLGDAVDPDPLHAIILRGDDTVVVSEVALVEVASACMAAERDRRVTDGWDVFAKFQSWCRPGKRIRLLGAPDSSIFIRAIALTSAHRIFALDAIHLAVALELVVPAAAGEPVRFLTRDRIQLQAAQALGFTVD
jgi:predicted nucleic acid-binding protein